MARRFRFSLKWLLVFFAVVACCLYIFYVRPTVLAKQFVQDVESGKFEPEPRFHVRLETPYKEYNCRYVAARLLPREWQDVQNCQHRVMATVSPPEFPVQLEIEIVAGPTRLRRTHNDPPLTFSGTLY